jgi:hypothetical protein
VPVPLDEDGNIVLPFDVMPGAVEALDAEPPRANGVEDGYPGPLRRDTTDEARRPEAGEAGAEPGADRGEAGSDTDR